jgi:hypothetical protein
MNNVTDRLAPIAVFAYNRRSRLAAMIESLRRCNGFEQSQVTIFVDGPKNDDGLPLVQEVRDYVAGIGLPNVTSVISTVNRGLRNSVSEGVTRIVEEHGRIIVLEDDLELSPIALTYFNRALDHYQDIAEVWSIAGYIYEAPALHDWTRTVVLPFAHPWGWATWKRAWAQFELDGRPSDADLNSAAFRKAFDMNGMYPFTTQLRNSLGGLVNSWYIHWYYTVFKHGGRSIFPPRRVLDNHGHAAGSHGGPLNPYDRLIKRPALLTTVPEFSDPLKVDYAVLDKLKKCWEMRVQRAIAFAGAKKRALLGRNK